MRTSFKASGLPLICQRAPVSETLAVSELNWFQRPRPPCASVANFNRLFMATPNYSHCRLKRKKGNLTAVGPVVLMKLVLFVGFDRGGASLESQEHKESRAMLRRQHFW